MEDARGIPPLLLPCHHSHKLCYLYMVHVCLVCSHNAFGYALVLFLIHSIIPTITLYHGFLIPEFLVLIHLLYGWILPSRYLFFKFIYFYFEREHMHIQAGEGQRGVESKNPKQAPHCQHRAQRGAQSHELQDNGLS